MSHLTRDVAGNGDSIYETQLIRAQDIDEVPETIHRLIILKKLQVALGK